MPTKPQIVDVRLDERTVTTGTDDICQQILTGLKQPVNEKTLPTLLLYNERGLRLYDDITTEAPEYYLFAAEEEILKTHADEIVRVMHSRGEGEILLGEVVLELGAGALRKTSHVLLGLSRLVSSPTNPVTYYALDLERRELERTLGQLAMSDVGSLLQDKVDAKGMLGTYDDGLKFVAAGGLRSHLLPETIRASVEDKSQLNKYSRDISPISTPSTSSSVTGLTSPTDMTTLSTPDPLQPPLHIMFLGSSLGNFSRAEGAAFLRSLPLRRGCGDTLLLGLDHDNQAARIETAYNDPKGYTRRFIMNGLKAAGSALGDEQMFDEDKWEYVGKYNKEERRHEAYYKSKSGQSVIIPSTNDKVSFLADEMIQVEVSYKYSETDVHVLFTEAELRPIQRWVDSFSQYSLWLLERPPFMFPLLSSPSASVLSGGLVPKRSYSSSPFGVPSIQDWQNMWTLWDFVTRRMIPDSMLFQKPIDLRHICLFYLGHIPTFLDIHLSRLLGEPHTDPQEFKDIFERGIDPNVDDPTKCHDHSEVPQSDEDWPQLETILDFQTRVRRRLLQLYDDIHSGRISLTRKVGRVLQMTCEHEALHAETLLYMLLQRAGTGTIPPPDFTPPNWASLAEIWEAAPKQVSPTVILGPAVVSLGHDDIEADDIDLVKALEVDGHEFGWDNESPKRKAYVNEFSIEWRPITNGQFYDFYKSGGQEQVKFPASWVEYKGETCVRTMYGPVPMKIAWNWPIMTSYDDFSAYAIVKGGRLPTNPELRLFYDKFEAGYEGGANWGFRNWHPIPSTTGGERDGGRGHNGGVWEWTSTLFDNYEGFVPSKLYPGYSKDFFDGTHQVVLGGSYATIPRIAERRSVRNWYQRKYPYSWIGARMVYDIAK
ncbi:hypothetical protein PILCRDRAFT_813358 [Piloderma croceum F 1598]|uniref:DUF323 domain-containing protein n=1 Tax=Piloderma croceum (strain F 1598) TaxID=765440 RepID=A0A0C3CI08_PILCF|nr:hypothetical protein PILCRDRAFT_813358 [Piloderma croceum F 1598]